MSDCLGTSSWPLWGAYYVSLKYFVLIYSQRYPFLPLLLISVYCAMGIFLCTLESYLVVSILNFKRFKALSLHLKSSYMLLNMRTTTANKNNNCHFIPQLVKYFRILNYSMFYVSYAPVATQFEVTIVILR